MVEKINNQELTNINGGVSKTIIGGIVLGVVFVASVIYGYIHPNKC